MARTKRELPAVPDLTINEAGRASARGLARGGRPVAVRYMEAKTGRMVTLGKREAPAARGDPQVVRLHHRGVPWTTDRRSSARAADAEARGASFARSRWRGALPGARREPRRVAAETKQRLSAD